jgi:hypothetical protein
MSGPGDGRRSAFRRLDDRTLPPLRRGLRTVGRGLAAPVRALNRAEERHLPGLFRVLWRQRQTIALAAASIMFAAAFVHLQIFEPGLVADAEQEDRVLEEADAGEPSQIVGPAIGDDLAEHERDAAVRLDGADDAEPRLAVVSFVEYLTVADVEETLDERVTTHRVQIRIPVEGEEPADIAVDDDLATAVEAALEAERGEMAAEEEELQRLLDSGTVEDEEFEEFYAEEVERLRAARELIDAGAGVVFAVAVDADVGTLRALAAHDLVRLVDLAEPGAQAPGTSFYGVLPDETGEASFGHLGEPTPEASTVARLLITRR